MKLVVIESPFAGQVVENVAYAKAAMLDCLARGEAPYASHLLFPQVLDDLVPAERRNGIDAGLAWASRAHLSAFYVDRGVSRGMEGALEWCLRHARPFSFRTLTGDDGALDLARERMNALCIRYDLLAVEVFDAARDA